MSNKVFSEKTFELGNNTTIECRAESTRSGFRHIAILRNNYIEVARAKCCYQNRTWESFEFESVIRNLLDHQEGFTEESVKELIEALRKDEHERVEQMFGTLNAICKMGELICDNDKDRNDWKARMLKAGLPQLDFPSDWDELSEAEKKRRLDAVTEQTRIRV